MLSQDQRHAFELYSLGKNIFISGPGGCGKSHLIREIWRDAKQKEKKIQVCALTGCAALLLECGARTLHSFAGIGLGQGTVEELIERVVKSPYRRKMWRETEILVVDEVSMLSKKLFEAIEAIARRTRRNPRPFGGLQLIFSGDFYQICPIGNPDEPDSSAFCFESGVWDRVFPLESTVLLTTVFRQREDRFLRLLEEARTGNLGTDSLSLLQDLSQREVVDYPTTRLFPIKRKVEEINRQEIDELMPPEHVYARKEHLDLPIPDSWEEPVVPMDETQRLTELQFLKNNLICDERLRLRVGARVMCVANLDNGLVNGSQGAVVGWSDERFPVVRFSNGTECVMTPHVWVSERDPSIGVSQVPLILAWAVTIHKAQGSTLDSAEIDIGASVFEHGQAYVALSRLKNLEGLRVRSFHPDSLKVNPKVRRFYEGLATRAPPGRERKTSSGIPASSRLLSLNQKRN